jgi:Cd2+/Zn2+-exporting ATPase
VDSLPEVKEAIVNFSTSMLIITLNEGISLDVIIDDIKKIVKALEPDVVVEKYDKSGTKPKESVCSSELRT